MIDIKKATRFFEQEIRSLELAPKINGCEMTEDWKEQIEICKASISALEKQIPKKPKISVLETYKCPMCNELIFTAPPYCKHCGQALLWESEE